MDVAGGGFYFILLPYNRGNEMALSCPVLREASKRQLTKAARFNSFLQAVQTTSTYLLQTFESFTATNFLSLSLQFWTLLQETEAW